MSSSRGFLYFLFVTFLDLWAKFCELFVKVVGGGVRCQGNNNKLYYLNWAFCPLIDLLCSRTALLAGAESLIQLLICKSNMMIFSTP